MPLDSVRTPRIRPRRLLPSVFALMLAAVMNAPVQAQAASAWSVSGFGTLGLSSQSDVHGWGFKRSSGQPGTEAATSATLDSRLGMQLNWNGGAQWEAAVQGVSFKRPAGTPLGESIEWAYIAYRPLPNTRLRLGRTSPDSFLFADSRNVGYALPWARPPVDYYGFASLESLYGADLEQRWTHDDVSWRARFALGSFKASSGQQGDRLSPQGRDTWTAGLTREDGGLLLKASYIRARLQAGRSADPLQIRQDLDQLPIPSLPGLASAIDRLRLNLWTTGTASYLALAAQYESGPWTLVTEGSDLQVSGSPLNARRAYASIGFRQGDITYYGVASRVTPRRAPPEAPDLLTPLTPLLGAQAAQQAQWLADAASSAGTAYRYDQSTVGVGLRWDFSPSAALKLQADRFNVHPMGSAEWSSSDGRAARGTLVSVLVDFVWGP
jgi:hypothetical protein